MTESQEDHREITAFIQMSWNVTSARMQGAEYALLSSAVGKVMIKRKPS